MYLTLFAIVATCLVAWGLVHKGNQYQVPFLMGVGFLGFMLPQLIGLQGDMRLPIGAHDRVALMALLCSLAVFLGYKIPRQPTRYFRWDINRDRLFRAALFLSVLGAIFSFLMSRAAGSVTGSQWSGPVVIFHFFKQIMDYGFVIALLLYVRTRSKRSLLLTIFCTFFYFDAIFIAARRATTAMVVLSILLAFWFQRRKAVPRWIFVPLLVFGMLVGTTSITDYRNSSKSGEGIGNITWKENIDKTLNQGGGEMRAATYQMAAIEELGLYDYGSFHWNRLIFNYVPGQLLSDSFKNSLYIHITPEYRSALAPERDPLTRELFGYEKEPGLTVSGLTDAFSSFWYFGFVKFILVGAIMKVLYVSSVQGNWTCQIIYILLITPAMHVVTHNTHWFFANWILMAVFLGPALLYARRKPTREVKRQVYQK